MKINIELTDEELSVAKGEALLCLLGYSKVAEAPKEVEVAPVTEQPALVTEPAAVPTAPPAFTRDELALAATQLMDQGKMPELQKVLAAMDVKALTELSEDRFAAFAAAIRKLGAKI